MNIGKWTKKLTAIMLCIACLLAFCACEKAAKTQTDSSGAVENKAVIALADVGEAVLHTEEQKTYLNMENLYNVSRVADGTKEMSRPLPVNLSWIDDSDRPITYTRVYISESADMSDPYTVITLGSEAGVYNLKVGTKYYWKVCTVYKDGDSAESDVAVFTTEDECPRNLYVDGTTNWRDLGGWRTVDGKRVRQGLIYRTGRLNTSNISSSVAEITTTGIKEATGHLKIKTEIDLRGKSESSEITRSVLGDDVNYFRCSMNYEGDCLSVNAEKVKKVFDILSEPDNYPVIFHCHIGTDRTGFVAYLINGLLGVKKQDLYKDYLFSNFAAIDGPRSLDDVAERYVASLDNYAGANLSEKIKSYLLSVGVTEEQIRIIKAMML